MKRVRKFFRKLDKPEEIDWVVILVVTVMTFAFIALVIAIRMEQ